MHKARFCDHVIVLRDGIWLRWGSLRLNDSKWYYAELYYLQAQYVSEPE